MAASDTNVRNYFVTGNTARGKYHVGESSFRYVKKLYVLSGEVGSAKSDVVQKLCEHFQREITSLEQIHSSLNPEKLVGFIMPDEAIGVVDEEACFPNDSIKQLDSTVQIHRITVDHILLPEPLVAYKAQKQLFKQKMNEDYTQAIELFGKALSIHEEMEQCYISYMDFDLADQIADELISKYLNKHSVSRNAKERHMFLGAATFEGPKDYIINLTEGMRDRVYLKGRPGSGKSTMLKKIAGTAIEKGIDVEMYRCGFDPLSVDMLIFPSLKVAIFDSTSPHEHFPVRDGDYIIDIYERTMPADTDEKVKNIVVELKEQYRWTVKQATSYLKKVKELEDELDRLYAQVVDQAALKNVETKIIRVMQK